MTKSGTFKYRVFAGSAGSNDSYELFKGYRYTDTVEKAITKAVAAIAKSRSKVR